MTPMQNPMFLDSDEEFVIKAMRNVKGYASFKIEKRPSKERPDGEFIRIVCETSQLVDKTRERSTLNA